MPHLTPQQRYWRLLGNSLQPATSPGPVSLLNLSSVEEGTLHSLLDSLLPSNTHLQEEIDTASLCIAIVDTLGDPRLEAMNEQCMLAGVTMWVFKPIGLSIEYASFSTDSACWACFERRHRLLDGPATYLYHALDDDVIIAEPLAYTPLSLSLALHLLVLEMEKRWRNDGHESSPALLHSFCTATLETQIHPVFQLPDCIFCGKAASVASVASNAPEPPDIDLERAMIKCG